MTIGRPSEFTQELADEICGLLAQGQSLRKVCENKHLPCRATVFNWFTTYPVFLDQYTRAKDESASSDADRIESIAEGVLEGQFDANAARVAIDAYKWSASRKAPKKYGDRQKIEHDVSTDMADRILRARERDSNP